MADKPPAINIVWMHYSLGVLYFETKDYESALKNYKHALSLAEKIDFTYGKSRNYTSIASISIAKGNYDEAREYLAKGIEGFRIVGHDDIGLSRALNDLGVIYRKLNQFDEAEKYLKESYEIRSAVGHAQGKSTSAYELGELMIAKNNADEALKWLEIALDLAIKTNTRLKEFQVHKAIAEAYKLKRDFEKAYLHLERFVTIQRDVTGQEAAHKLKQLQTRMATEKAEKEAEIERIRNVEQMHEHIDIIADKNKEIVDSINYAWRIQSALLASDNLLKENLKEFFVFFKPKDIVSGDFYWASKKGNRFYIAVCDSTGHGVPGAFMSILNTSYMVEAINEKEIAQPDQIFNHVRSRLIENVSKDGQKDGMDGILLCIEGDKVMCAAAYNPLLMVHNGKAVVIRCR